MSPSEDIVIRQKFFPKPIFSFMPVQSQNHLTNDCRSGITGIPVIASKNAGAVLFLSTPSVFLENPKDVEELFRLLQKQSKIFFQAFPSQKYRSWKLFSNGENAWKQYGTTLLRNKIARYTISAISARVTVPLGSKFGNTSSGSGSFSVGAV